MAFGGVVKLKGESEYRRALKNIQNDLKVVGSELKVVSSQFDKNDKSQEAVSAQTNILNSKLEAQKEKLQLITNQYNLFSQAAQKSAQEHEQLGRQLQDAKAKLEAIKNTSGEASDEYKTQQDVVQDLQNQYDESTKAQDKNRESVAKLAVAMNNAQTDVIKTTKEIESLGDESKDTGKEAEDLGDSAKDAEKKIEDLGDGSNDAGRKTEELGDKVEDAGKKAITSGDGFTVMNGAIANLVSDGIQKAIDGLKELAKQTFDSGANFQSAMSQVAAISGATGDDLQKLTDKAKEMGAKTKYTATESAEAFNYMAMAGWDTQDMLDGIEGVMNLAAASGEDLATTSDIVTDALTAMGYSAGDAGELADVMASASANANTNVGLMGATFQYAAPIVGALGYNMQDTATAIGLMANSGIKGEKAGTALRSILTRLSAPTKDTQDAMDALGISLTDSEGNMKDLNTVMGDLRNAFSGLSESQQAQYAKSLAGQEAMSGLLAIVNASPDDYQKLTDAVANATTNLSDFNQSAKDAGVPIDDLRSKMAEVGVTSDEFDKAIQQSGGNANAFVIALKQSADAGTNVNQILKDVGTSTEDLQTAFDGTSGSAEDMANTMNDNVLGQLTLLKSKIEGIMIDVFDGSSEKIQGAIDSISEMLDSIDWDAVAETISNGVQKAIDILQWIIDNKDLVISALSGIVAGFITFKTVGTITEMVGGFVTFFDTIKNGEGIVAAFNATMGMNPFVLIIAAIAGLVTAFITLYNTNEDFRQAIDVIWNAIKTIIGGAIDGIVVFFTETIPDAINSMVEWFSELPEKIGNFLSDVIGKVSSWVSDMVDKATQVGSDFVSNVVNFFTQLPSKIWNWLSNALGKVGNFARDMANKGRQAGRELFDNIVNKIKELPDKMLDIGSNIVSGIWDGISGGFEWIKNKITGWVGDVMSFIKGLFGIHSPSTLMRDEVGKYLAQGIGVGFEDEMHDVSQQMADAIPTQFDTEIVAHADTKTSGYGTVNDSLVTAMIEALKGVKIEMDSEEMGHFVDKTVTGLIYN